jgi:hypothetical protein
LVPYHPVGFLLGEQFNKGPCLFPPKAGPSVPKAARVRHIQIPEGVSID